MAEIYVRNVLLTVALPLYAMRTVTSYTDATCSIIVNYLFYVKTLGPGSED